ncbi:unnamed protein product [Didymodactylos carnosus]|uniref:Uncharacterized protein n=1 Tax=Didymodactylos carnosus TaxID=1234261 RepID=A0A813T5I7_9BILA|nr:unnamed protein product [Didymodactylos carnosus]CAF0806877.1 unnamed protein product [Didymodactylos carnosus]CAF3504147.1 unnamed protein product [Didymodactylos carnosus]CAF3592346.1 unnamed protein product [Didymodactylos carnosus]
MNTNNQLEDTSLNSLSNVDEEDFHVTAMIASCTQIRNCRKQLEDKHQKELIDLRQYYEQGLHTYQANFSNIVEENKRLKLEISELKKQVQSPLVNVTVKSEYQIENEIFPKLISVKDEQIEKIENERKEMLDVKDQNEYLTYKVEDMELKIKELTNEIEMISAKRNTDMDNISQIRKYIVEMIARNKET